MTAEIRAYILDIESTIKKLENLGAEFKGDYAFTDYIYKLKDDSKKIDLNNEFMRIREYEKSQWTHKKYVLVHKLTRWKDGNRFIFVPLKKEFDKKQDAEKEISNSYELNFKFHKHGFEYWFKSLKIHVEEIEYLEPTIEVTAEDKESIDNLFKKLDVSETIFKSVPKLIEEKLNK